MEKVLKDLDIRTVFKTTLTLRHSLTKVKTPADLVNTKGVVYKIPCECGRVYVGETGRTLKQRVTKHKQAVKNAESNNGLAVQGIRLDGMKQKLFIGKNDGPKEKLRKAF